MKIALIRPNYHTHLITPPLGLGYLSSYLKEKGFDVQIIDGLNLGLSIKKIIDLCSGADFVGINCLSDYFLEVIKLSREFKKAGKTVVLGGSHVSALPELTLAETKGDYAIIGEGEISLFELATALKSASRVEKIPGVLQLNGREFIEREFIPELDTLPFPDWEQIDPRQYRKAPHGGVIKKFPVAPIISSRGCPFECTFCASTKFWKKKIRYRSPRNVVEEIEYLVKKFDVKEIHFEDDNFTLRKSHVTEICEEILRRNLKIFWATPNGIRADTIDEGLLRLMKKSGCYAIAFGVESANEHILKNVKKEVSLETITKAIHMAHREGIITQGFFIFGLPGETQETINNTIEYASKVPLDKAQFLLLDILPGSALWYMLEGKFEVRWDKRSYQQVRWLPDNLPRDVLESAPSLAFRKFFKLPRRFFKMVSLIKPGQLEYVLRRIRDFGIFSATHRDKRKAENER